nr:unnamed protein product [Spirometra erinaceieuropaei]
MQVEPLLQQFAKRRASNFRALPADGSQPTGRSPLVAASAGASGGGLPKLVMPRPVMRANSLTSARLPASLCPTGGATPASAFTPPLHVLAAMRAAIGEGSECSELSSITRSIAPAATARCRCASHASSCEGGTASARGPKSVLSREGEEDEEESDAAAAAASAAAASANARIAPSGLRRPKTEPQPHHEVNNSRLDLLHSTSPRYIVDKTTLLATAQTTAVAEATPPPPPALSPGSPQWVTSKVTETGTSLRGRTASSVTATTSNSGSEAYSNREQIIPKLAHFCGAAAASAAVCSAPDCSANFHSACFQIWHEECVLETGYLYCPVCGRPWSFEASSAANREPTETPRIPLESTGQLMSASFTRKTPEVAETAVAQAAAPATQEEEEEKRDSSSACQLSAASLCSTGATAATASSTSSSPAPTSASCMASYFRSAPTTTTTMTTAIPCPATMTPMTTAAATSTPVTLMSPTNIPLLCQKNAWAAWVSAFSEEMNSRASRRRWANKMRESAMTFISPA